MFEKRFSAETATTATGWVKIAQVFNKIGSDIASELEIRRAARDLGIDISGFGQYCEACNGGFKLKGSI